ncbi:MAG TPA: class I SAM-dependent methyltransferase [Hymenobacter sp.]|uniref:class I SAM-dependent methyltransferase n=1 Tax=Hymenobacter sp. TaxID=1898978 RepID=UPI002D7FD552|nr:class I SAM-dependent methyltransferase [Hymenobacter sp.]HET9504442.1 class I SAM-dependent methyltransferase [Hymenobacter sp.]
MTELLQPAPPVAAHYRPARVRALFDQLAGTYGAAEWLSGGQLGRWRRSLVAALRWPAAGPVSVVDLMAGGAELWEPLRQRLGARLTVAAVDFSAPMLARAARQHAPGLTLLQADALASGLPAGATDAVTCAFGLKTLAPSHYPALAAEAARLLRPGGQLALLEFDLPAMPWLRAAMLTYLQMLPATLRHLFPEAAGHAALPRYACAGVRWPALLAALRAAGFGAVRQRRLWPGCARLVVAEWPG